MLVSFTIFHKGGLILYQHLPEETLHDGDDEEDQYSSATALLSDILNTWMSEVYLNPTKSLTDAKVVLDANRTTTNRTTTTTTTTKTSTTTATTTATATATATTTKQVVEWQDSNDYVAVAVYPDIRREDHPWIAALLSVALAEFQVFERVAAAQTWQEDTIAAAAAAADADVDVDVDVNRLLPKPMDTSLFHKTFQLLFQQYKNNSNMGTMMTAASNSNSASTSGGGGGSSKAKNNNNKSKSKGKSGGKEKRNWHDGKAKVTKEAMAELDFSKNYMNKNNSNNGRDDDDEYEDSETDKDAVALAEARAAYLPTDADLADLELAPSTEALDDSEDSENSWGSSLKGLFQQATGQKVLTKADLQVPLEQMHNTLTSKNVAADIAQHVCDNVESSLVGKKLSSMYRVKTAVRQALEKAVNKLLLSSTKLDLLRQVVSKRDALFGTKRPYVIVVVGINGVGKSTSLAKLAFYLKSNGCTPLLAACDTFRSGAVEQLSVHAKCLELPIFHQGYSKDPSVVAKAAIAQASKDGNDVVLVDTAGRMQNNVPLMKALGKLTADNQPDLVVFVGEALVGNDGVDQVRMFNQAVGSLNRNQKVNAILLTKFDTVSDKVGAALTMTHVTNAPILFVGTGQKYHHLQKLSTPSVIRSLFK